jgi:NAD(P)-dependent dehydrogenase (short-subunit alcohol dehydrogenase family)
MAGRLGGKVAIVTGAGQTPGGTIGNGRATALLFAREGARVLLVDRRLDSAAETHEMIRAEGGASSTFEADVSRAADCQAAVDACLKAYGRIDVLHNNVGIGTGDGGPTQLTEEAWDRIFDVNLKSVFLMCKSALPPMREQRSGCILNVSSIASICSVGILAYKTSKAGVNALTHSLATGNARYGIRVNAILPGLMNTPMAIEGIARARGVPPTRPCSSPRTRRASSPGCCCPSTAARAPASAESPLRLSPLRLTGVRVARAGMRAAGVRKTRIRFRRSLLFNPRAPRAPLCGSDPAIEAERQFPRRFA